MKMPSVFSVWRKRRSTKPTVLCVGADLSSNGGIASVLKSHYREWERGPRDFDYRLLKTSYYKDRPWVWEPFLFAGALTHLAWAMFTLNVVLVHVHTSSGWSFVRKSIVVCLSRLLRTKVILHIHSSRFYEWFLVDKKIRRTYINYIFRRCDLVVVLCRDWEWRLQQCYPHVSVRVLRNPSGVMNPPAGCATHKDVFTVLFMGFLIPSKGVRDLLSVAKRIASGGPCNVRIIVAGKGELEQEIAEYVRGNRIDQYVRLVGWVTGTEKARLLGESSLFFLPSYREGMPVSILEAMSYGLPILSTRISGIPDVVYEGKNGYLCEPGDVEGYLRVIHSLCNNRHLADALGAQSREYSKRFANDVVYNELEQLYREVSLGQVASRRAIVPGIQCAE